MLLRLCGDPPVRLLPLHGCLRRHSSPRRGCCMEDICWPGMQGCPPAAAQAKGNTLRCILPFAATCCLPGSCRGVQRAVPAWNKAAAAAAGLEQQTKSGFGTPCREAATSQALISMWGMLTSVRHGSPRGPKAAAAAAAAGVAALQARVWKPAAAFPLDYKARAGVGAAG